MSTFGRPFALNVSRTTSKRGQAVNAKAVDQSVDTTEDVGAVLHEGGAVRIEVLALHVDHEQRCLAVTEVVDHW